jgi:hypothetical protein
LRNAGHLEWNSAEFGFDNGFAPADLSVATFNALHYHLLFFHMPTVFNE